MDKIKNKGLVIGGGIFVIIVIVLKFTVLRRKPIVTNPYYSQQKKPVATSRRSAPVRKAPVTRRPVARRTPSNIGSKKNSQNNMNSAKANKNRTFTGYLTIYKGIKPSSVEVKSIPAERLEITQNIFQDFKKSLEQKNKAKLARVKADEAIRNLLIKVSKLKENYKKAMEKYLEQPKKLLESADTLFKNESYLEAENSAKRAINLCDTININTLSKLIRESVTFKYQGFYYVEKHKVAILLMIRNASGIIEGTSKNYLYVKVNDIINANDENVFKVMKISQDKVILMNIKKKKSSEIPFEYSEDAISNQLGE